jgi:hypothetical protein
MGFFIGDNRSTATFYTFEQICSFLVVRVKSAADRSSMIKNTFSKEQIESLKTQFSKVETVSVESLPKFHKLLGSMNDEQLHQVVQAGIKFLSKLAVNEISRRNQ